MTFQFDTLLRVARFIRAWDPAIKVVAGGYHVTALAHELAIDPGLPLDFMVRGEGEATFRELVTELENRENGLPGILGLSHREGCQWVHNPERPLLDPDQISLPRRGARLASGFYFFGLPLDTIETSRGCRHNCKFCSITQMYGKTFRRFPVERVIADLKAIRDQGTRAVFLVDDNITSDVAHFQEVCRAIIANRLNDMRYIVQVTATGIARNPSLVADMDKANFRYVFIGFESMLPPNLKSMNKPTSPEINLRAAEMLRQHQMAVLAGSIVGYPDDTRASIRQNLRLVSDLKPDVIYAQYLTPYPNTVIRRELLGAGLVVNPEGYRTYDGFSCNVRTKHLSRRELYLCLKKEIFKCTFRLPIASNFLLRTHPRVLAAAYLKYLAIIVRNLLTARQQYTQFDI